MQLTLQGAQHLLRRVYVSKAPARRGSSGVGTVELAPPREGAQDAPGSGRPQLKVPTPRSHAFAFAASVGLHAAVLLLITQTPVLVPSLSHAKAPVAQVLHVELVRADDAATTVNPLTASTLAAAAAAAAVSQPRTTINRPAETRKPVARTVAAAEPNAASPDPVRAPSAASETDAISALSPQSTPSPASASAQVQAVSESAQPQPGASTLARTSSRSGAGPSEPLRRAAPAYLHTPEPEYPPSAREEGQEGLVVLRVLVSIAGRPEQVQIARPSGFRALDAAAVQAIKRWKFSAATDGRSSIEAWMDIPVRFRLE